MQLTYSPWYGLVPNAVCRCEHNIGCNEGAATVVARIAWGSPKHVWSAKGHHIRVPAFI